MAKITGVFTGMKGKLGNTVLQGWKGVQVLRTLVIPANPRTARQTTNRTLFTNLVEMFKPVVEQLVWVFWNPFMTAKKTGWANLIGLNQGLQQGTAIDYALVEISKGSLPGEAIVSAIHDTVADSVSCTWLNSGSVGGADSDFALFCVFDKVEKKWYFSAGGNERADLSESIFVPAGAVTANLISYLIFFTGDYAYPDILSCSDSSALQVTI